MRWLVFGSTGWIGGILINLLRKDPENKIYYAKSRLEFVSAVCDEIDTIKPDRVINAAGLTGVPNIDWLEDHKIEGLRVNVIGTLALIDACYARNIHITQLATGCIYEYDDAHPIGGTPFVETDPPNFSGSYYSKTKRIVEDLASPLLTNTLWLRIRMPLTPDAHPRNFITKIRKYKKVVNIPNSMSVLDDLCPAAILLAKNKETGIYNFTNPGTISHNEILDMYKEYVDPTFTWENFTVEDQSKILKAGRSNNELDVTKLLNTLKRIGSDIRIQPIKEAARELFIKMARTV